MKHYILTIMTLCMAAMCAMAQNKHYELEVGDYTSLNVLDNINVAYESNPQLAGKAIFDAPESVAAGLIFNNNTRGKLTIQVTTDVLGTPNLPTIHVYSTVLNSVENAGDSTLTLRHVKPLKGLKVLLSDNGRINVHDIEVEQLDLQLITGKGVIQASGTCDRLNMRVLGKGSIDAIEVTAPTIVCKMTGTGTIDCTAQGSNLTVRGSGTGRVNYLGTPANVAVRKLGPLKVTQMDN